MDTMEYKKELQNVSKPLEERVPNTPNFSWVEEDVKTTDLPFGSETRDSDVYNGGTNGIVHVWGGHLRVWVRARNL